MRAAAFATALAIMVAGSFPAMAGAARVTRAAGGSDYMFYSLDGCQHSGWVTTSYLANRAVIDGQLAEMYRNGQRRLRISIQLGRRPMADVSADAPMDPDYQREVSAFLAQIKRTGFAEVEVAIGGGSVQPFHWQSWDEDAYQGRWQRIIAIRGLLVQSGLKYLIDLYNEGIPTANQPMLLRYTQRLWSDYVQKFGAADTVGFSIIAAPGQDRFAQIRAVYGNTLPTAFDLHIYDNSGAAFMNAHERLAAMGLGYVPWIIGESFYNDPQEASELADAIRRTHQPVLYLLQWPLTSGRQCKGVDVAAPLSFDAYAAAGF